MNKEEKSYTHVFLTLTCKKKQVKYYEKQGYVVQTFPLQLVTAMAKKTIDLRKMAQVFRPLIKLFWSMIYRFTLSENVRSLKLLMTET